VVSSSGRCFELSIRLGFLPSRDKPVRNSKEHDSFWNLHFQTRTSSLTQCGPSLVGRYHMLKL
jgi:hypothetical protein